MTLANARRHEPVGRNVLAAHTRGVRQHRAAQRAAATTRVGSSPDDLVLVPKLNAAIPTELAAAGTAGSPSKNAAVPREDNRLRTAAGAERRRDTSRVEAFSDGVYAVAITLLVLNVVVPAHPPGGLMRALGDLWPAYVAYLASFLFVGVSWVNHHAAFKRIRVVDAGFLWVNIGILLTVVPAPFPTAVLANALRDGNPADSQTAAALYGVVLALHAVAWTAFLQYASRHPDLLRRDSDAKFMRMDSLRAPFGVIVYGGAGALGYFVSPLIALALFAALPIFYGLTAEGWRGARATDSEPE